MANKIQQRRGLKSAIPTLSAGELGYTTDTRELFIGTGSGNVNVGGSHWYRGTAMSGTSTATNAYSYSACPQVKLDDLYLNTSNGNMYACTTAGSGSSAKWTYQGCIKGATGATGAKGATGATGAAGQDLQAVYSSTPTVIGTWVDGRPIYRVAWSCTKAQNNMGAYIPTVMDIPGMSNAVLNDNNIWAINSGLVRESYCVCSGLPLSACNAKTYNNITDLSAGITACGNNDYIIYIVLEFVA